MFQLAANIILIIHCAFIGFVLLGFLLIVVGIFLKWSWIRNFWFRVLHLISILFVTIQTWAGRICPLTIWENNIREISGDISYKGSFVQFWLQKLIYYDFPFWVFKVAYTSFGIMVIITWIYAPPALPFSRQRAQKNEYS